MIKKQLIIYQLQKHLTKKAWDWQEVSSGDQENTDYLRQSGGDRQRKKNENN